MPRILPDEYRPIHEATRALAGLNTDRATLLNGVGFNGRDSEFGNSIAAKPWELWTPRMLGAAYRMLGTYRYTQLPRLGFDYASFPVPNVGLLEKAWEDEWREKSATATSERTIVAQPVGWGLAWVVQDREFGPIKDAVKFELRGHWDSPTKMWTVKGERPEQLQVLEHFAEKWGFKWDSLARLKLAALRKLHGEAAARAETLVEASKASDADLHIDGLGGELRPFQKAGVRYALEAKRTFLADEMGLGKTVQALAAIHASDGFPAIVVCPASLKLNWEREALKWIPGRRVRVVNGRPPTRLAEITIINYDVLGKHLDTLLMLQPKTVVLDESHYIKNPKAKRTVAATKLMESAEYRYCLTGTPVTNRPIEFVSQLRALGRLDSEFGGWKRFVNRYCNAFNNGFGMDLSGAAHLDELNRKLRGSCYIRRLKRDVFSELGEKQRVTLPIEIDNRKEYEFAEKQLIEYLKAEVRADRAYRASIAHLPAEEQERLIAEREKSVEMKARRAEHLVRIEKLKQLVARGKLTAINEWIEDFIEQQKLVLFGNHREIVDAIAERFNAPRITGDTPIAERQAAVDRFQTDPDCKLIVLNIQAGGVGLTLTASSNPAFVELGWNPATHDQAEDRTHRIGQTETVTAWYLLGARTIDEDIAQLIEKKRVVVDAATEGEGAPAKQSIMGDLISRLVEKGGGA